jgi:hypothetical protein
VPQRDDITMKINDRHRRRRAVSQAGAVDPNRTLA